MGQPGEGLTGEGSEAARGESREVEARGRVGSTENRQEGREWAWGCTGPVLSDPMNCSTPGFPVLHYLLEFAQTHPDAKS